MIPANHGLKSIFKMSWVDMYGYIFLSFSSLSTIVNLQIFPTGITFQIVSCILVFRISFKT